MPRDEQKLLNSTGLILTIFLRSSTTGQGLTGKTYSDFAGQVNTGNAASSALAFASGSIGDSHSSGKIVGIGNGRYYWHVPDSLFTALGQVNATIQVSGAIDVYVQWQVVAVDRTVAAFGANTTTPPTASANASQVRSELAIELARIDAAISSRNATTPPTVGAVASQVRTELAVELGRIDENVSAPKTLTAGTLATLFDDSDASQQLTDFFAGLIDRFDEAGDTPVATIAAAMLAGLVSHANWIELLADAEAARAASVANGLAIAGLNNFDPATQKVILADAAHGGTAATLTLKKATLRTSDNVPTLLIENTNEFGSTPAIRVSGGSGAALQLLAAAGQPGIDIQSGAEAIRLYSSSSTYLSSISVLVGSGTRYDLGATLADGVLRKEVGGYADTPDSIGEYLSVTRANVGTMKTTVDKIAGTLESDGAGGWRYTVGALYNASTGGGGGGGGSTDFAPVLEKLPLIGRAASQLDLTESAIAVIEEVLAGITSVTITRVGPGFDPDTSTFELIAGDDYIFANEGHTDFGIGFTGDPTGWTVRVSASSKYPAKFLGIGSLVEVGGEQKLRVEWPKSQTNTQPASYTWQAKLIDPDGNVRTKIEGPLCLKASTE